MPTNTLTDSACKRAAALDSPIKLFDGHGLYLFVSPAGGKRWRMAYRVAGKPQTATFGPYPSISLADARKRRDELRARLAAGESPKAQSAVGAMPFRAACEAYWAGRSDVSDGYRDNALRGLELHLWPALGTTPVGQITRALLLEPLLRMDAAGKHVYVRKVRMWAGQVFDWAVERGVSAGNPASAIRPEKAFGRSHVESFAALELGDVRPFMERLAFEGQDLGSVLACKLMALTWARTQEIRMMRWEQIEGALWRVPKKVMKRRRVHLVPLSRQALALLDVLRSRGNGQYVFQADHRGDRPISENTVLALIARMGYRGRMTGHGWRSVASTWANEAGFNPDAIERQLSHAPDDDVRAVYNRAEYFEIRKKMMQAWADWLLPA